MVERSEPINSLPARGGWEGRASNSPLVTAAALNADDAGVSLH